MPEHFPLPRGAMSQQSSPGNKGCLYQTEPTPQVRRARSKTGCFLPAQNENFLSTLLAAEIVPFFLLPFSPFFSFLFGEGDSYF